MGLLFRNSAGRLPQHGRKGWLLLLGCGCILGACGGADQSRQLTRKSDAGVSSQGDVAFALPTADAAAVYVHVVDAATGSADWGDGPAPSAAADAGCAVKTIDLSPRPAEVLFVLDRSNAMAASLADGSSPWSESVQAIGRVTTTTQQAFAWGLSLFPKAGAGAGCCQMPADDDATVEVPCASSTEALIASALASASPTGGGAPTARAIMQGASALVASGTSTSKYLVLMTGGDPTCANDSLCTGVSSPDYARTKSAVSHVASVLGIPVAVVAVALPANSNWTQPNGTEQFFADLANLGGMPSTSQSQSAYYSGSSAADLANAIGTILEQARSCSFALPSPVEWPSDVVVQVGGNRVPRDTSHQDGWDYGDDGASVVLFGKQCDVERHTKSASTVQFLSSCPNVIIE